VIEDGEREGTFKEEKMNKLSFRYEPMNTGNMGNQKKRKGAGIEQLNSMLEIKGTGEIKGTK